MSEKAVRKATRTTYLAIDARRFDLNLRLKGLQLIGHIFAVQFGINVNAGI